MFKILRHRKVAPWATFFVFVLHIVQVPHDDTLSWIDVLHLDKWVHACMFFGITLLWIIYPWHKFMVSWRLPAALILYAIFLELVQGWLTAHRSADIWDLTVDVGAIVVTYYYRDLILQRFRSR
jgi:hypothetical protein